MAECSVDDMYNGCRGLMMEMVEKKYKEEIKQFQDDWNKAERCAERNMIYRETVDQALTKYHMQAICLYTLFDGMFFETFNEVVRTGREQYGTSFPYHSFHFQLTTAIQLLRKNQRCHTSYRRTNVRLTGDVGQIIRFGSFASSSLRKDKTVFGRQSCFKIRTCYGAYLKNYSDFKYEEEVLIPPYEKFRITKILKGKDADSAMPSCKVVYVMEHAGVRSILNCSALGS
ncbi:hypothetical protein LDENG_00206870 [Lucifuga dentata]|nr:hypothetical protein LDENG_00206870 [Lucifuga dentata]